MHEFRLFERVASYGSATAIHDHSSIVSYSQLLSGARSVASTLLSGSHDLSEGRVGLLTAAGSAYVSCQWGTWLAGGVSVPLSLAASDKELSYAISDSGVSTLIAARDRSETLNPLCKQLGVRLLFSDDCTGTPRSDLPKVARERRAMILYTSGTTSRPKGVVSTFANIEAQIDSLVTAWRWESSDAIPLFLPLHHIHGIINVLSCALWSGACVDAFSRFKPESLLKAVAEGGYTVFMAVPTIYVKLIQLLDEMPPEERAQVVWGFRSMRLMVSGSAALPASVHERWRELTGQALLERYGMTEIGMALSNPLDGERRPGAVGQPLPGMEVRLFDEKGLVVQGEGTAGEIQVRGENVFREYWGRPEATRDAFIDGWFRTGDIAIREDGYYRILGRSSVDIIKSGGYKLSALEIESVLLDHPAVRECAVVGLPDETWGEIVAAAVVQENGSTIDGDLLQAFCEQSMSSYKVPRCFLFVDSLPRNAMGKITKPAVRSLFGAE